MPLPPELKKRIDDLVQDKSVVLFMKGSRHFPQCGFSAQVVQILNELTPSYETINVLTDAPLRDGIKEYSSWPTIPQLYIRGQFVGGCDIVKEMYASGELQKMLGAPQKVVGGSGASATPPNVPKVPKVTVTERAASAFRDAEGDAEGNELRLEINAQFQYELFFGPPQPGDVSVTTNGVTILFDAASAPRADGVSIDFVDRPGGGGFKIDNPNAPAGVRPLTVKELKGMMDGGETFELFDVRPDGERAIAKIERARQLDEAGKRHLASLDKNVKIVFHCHHGGRSRAAAEDAVRSGFANVFNVEGGIDAWSQSIDPSVKRY